MAQILFLHDTSLTTPRGAELTIKELMQLGEARGHTVTLDLLQDFSATQKLVAASQLVVVNSMSRCSYDEKGNWIEMIETSKVPNKRTVFKRTLQY